MPDRRIVSLVILLLAACAKKEEPVTAAAPTAAPPPVTTTTAAPATTSTPPAASTAAPADAIATADGETSGVTASVKELKRTSGGTISLKFTITNGSAKDFDFGYHLGDKDHDVTDFASIGGVQLIDPVGKKKYFVARDSENKCVCSSKLKDLKAGDSINLWAKFPAPPEDVAKISIIIPRFSPMDDVPISK